MMGRQQRHATFDGEKAPKADVIGLQKLCKIADELSGLLHPALGVAGKGVMISQKSPREVTITKSGLEILLAVRGRGHPLADLIIDMAASHVREWGDGAKRILLMLQLFLRAIRRQQNSTSFSEAAASKWRCDLVGQVARFRRHILPRLDRRLAADHSRGSGRLSFFCESIFSLENAAASASLASIDILRSLVTSFMATRFPQTTASALTDLFMEYLQWHLKSGLADRIENTLSDVCEKFGQSRCLLRLGGQGEVASNSRLLEVGCILIGQHVTIHSSRINPATLRKRDDDCSSSKSVGGLAASEVAKEPCYGPAGMKSPPHVRFIAWLETPEADETKWTYDATKNGTRTAQEDLEDSLGRLNAWKLKRIETFMRKLSNDLAVDLIITDSKVPDYSRPIIEKYNIAVIENAPKDEVVDLASEADILAFTGKLDENPDLIDDAFVGKLGRPLREARLGRHYYTKFYLSNKLDYRHVLVCGLTSTSASQYAKALLQCSTLLATSSKTSRRREGEREETDETLRTPERPIGDNRSKKATADGGLPRLPPSPHGQKVVAGSRLWADPEINHEKQLELEKGEEVHCKMEKVAEEEGLEVITIIPLLAAASRQRQRWRPPAAFTTTSSNRPTRVQRDSFEHEIVSYIDSILPLEANSGEVLIALRTTFTHLIGVISDDPFSSGETIPYPLDAALAQISTMLDMAVTLLRIERICPTRKRIKEVL